jgi:hypothetical protein
MNEETIKLIDESATELSSGLYAMMYHGRLLILEKINVWGLGYRQLVSFSYDDIIELNNLADKETDRLRWKKGE